MEELGLQLFSEGGERFRSRWNASKQGGHVDQGTEEEVAPQLGPSDA